MQRAARKHEARPSLPGHSGLFDLNKPLGV